MMLVSEVPEEDEGGQRSSRREMTHETRDSRISDCGLVQMRRLKRLLISSRDVRVLERVGENESSGHVLGEAV